MAEYKITKMQKVLEVNCDKCHNFYYLVYFRLYNDAKTRYRKGKFVVWFDAFDVQEYFEQDYYTTENVKTLASELAVNTMETYYKDYNDTTELYKYCAETIDDYNKTARFWI